MTQYSLAPLKSFGSYLLVGGPRGPRERSLYLAPDFPKGNQQSAANICSQFPAVLAARGSRTDESISFKSFLMTSGERLTTACTARDRADELIKKRGEATHVIHLVVQPRGDVATIVATCSQKASDILRGQIAARSDRATVGARRQRPGTFTASIASTGDVMAVSRQPFLDAARRLLKLGHDPSTRLVMRWRGSSIDSLISTIGIAAGLAVREEPLRFEKYRPFVGIINPKEDALPKTIEDEPLAVDIDPITTAPATSEDRHSTSMMDDA